MKLFDIGDILTATTGRFVSSRGMEGIYEIYNFLTGDSLYTHQLPRAARECEPWLAAQYPRLMKDSGEMQPLIERLEDLMKEMEPKQACERWVDDVQAYFLLPRVLPVEPMGADMHTHIDPVEEALAMMGDDKVIVLDVQ